MTNELFVKIVLGLVSICGALITAYIVPYIKVKLGAAELDKLAYYVTVAVRCAEQLYTVEQWQEKKEYVMDYCMGVVNEKLHIDLSYEDVNTIVEGIVNEVKKDRVTELDVIAEK